MKRELVNVAKLGVKAVATGVMIKYVNTLMKHRRVTSDDIITLNRRLSNFMINNVEVLRSVNADLPDLLVDDRISDVSIPQDILVQTNAYKGDRECLYTDDGSCCKSNACLYLGNIIRLYGKKNAYKHACKLYIRVAICESTDPYTIPYKYSDNPTKYSNFIEHYVNRIYKECTHI